MNPGGGGNKNVNNLPYGPNGRPWSFGLFDCFSDLATCKSPVLSPYPFTYNIQQACSPGVFRASFTVLSRSASTILPHMALLIPNAELVAILGAIAAYFFVSFIVDFTGLSK
jgi:hypothetical protein